jgi:amino acid transporter
MNINQQISGSSASGGHFNRVFVLSTAMLSFISFWKAAAIVLCDFGSSAYYSGSIAMNAFGAAFPWFVLGVMLFAGVMLAVYTESCLLFTRGGVYVVVREAIGPVMAKLSVSALLFDYVLTGPISSVTAGVYLGALLANLLPFAGIHWNVSPQTFSVVFAIIVTVYFWRSNIKGVQESSDNNVRIMAFVTVVAVILAGWSLYTLFSRGNIVLPPFRPVFTEHALGWTPHIPWLKAAGLVGFIMAFGHSIVALSGLETLAQVYRDLEDPKYPNLKKTVITIFVFSVLFTGGVTFLAALIIPPEHIAQYADNLLGGLALELKGPYVARVAMQALVVLSGALMLVGAVNTSFFGSNGVLNRVAEDGILHDWFRSIHPKYGTTYRLVNMVASAQIITILLSRGDIFLIGEAYAFGVLWSITFTTLSVIILRFRKPEEKRDFHFPFNIHVGNIYVPIGLAFVFIILLSVVGMNLFTKKIATIGGLSFSFIFFIIFQISEKMNEKKAQLLPPEEESEEQMNTRVEANILKVAGELKKPRRILVPVRNPHNLTHLVYVLEHENDEETDIIVMSAKISKGLQSGAETMTDEDREVFSAVILTAEKYGKTVKPVFVFSNDPFYSIAQVAHAADVNEVVMGVSGVSGAEVQLEKMAMAWGMMKKPDEHREVTARVVWPGRQMSYRLS